ncbi:MAG: pyruvate kinase [bacterium]
MRRTKIVATLGPASSDPAMLDRLVAAGVDVFRLNYSHGTPEGHAAVAAAVREAALRAGREVALLQDLGGPKIRTGEIDGGETLELFDGAEVLLGRDAGPVRPGRLTTTLPALVDELAPGERVLLRDGRILLRVVSREGDAVRLRVERGGTLVSRSGVNLPDTRLSVPSLEPKDASDLAHGLDLGADITALSFVRRAADLAPPREIAQRRGRDLFLVAKIEKPEAVENLDAILEKADAVMVARGDLGVEIPAEDVPLVQKRIIHAANARRVPVITATQMLESMVESPVPTRAEASDVANAILDGTDAVMLSAETATGRYPEEAVRTMVRIAEKVDVPLRDPARRLRSEGRCLPPPEAVARAASRAAEDVAAKAIVVYTESGSTARLLSSQRPHVPIFALSPEISTVRRLRLSWGVFPQLMPRVDRMADMLGLGERLLVDAQRVSPGDRIVVVSGSRAANRGGTNMMKILTVGELD